MRPLGKVEVLPVRQSDFVRSEAAEALRVGSVCSGVSNRDERQITHKDLLCEVDDVRLLAQVGVLRETLCRRVDTRVVIVRQRVLECCRREVELQVVERAGNGWTIGVIDEEVDPPLDFSLICHCSEEPFELTIQAGSIEALLNEDGDLLTCAEALDVAQRHLHPLDGS